MTTSKKRIKIALSKNAEDNLNWLLEQERKQNNCNKRIYPCDIFERLLANEVEILKVFGTVNGGVKKHG